MVEFKGKRYSSKKHPILEHIFSKYYTPDKPQDLIPFYLEDISLGYKACGTSEPVSISNTILDLTRQDRGINSRVPPSISCLGYDLRKKTGIDTNGKKFAGEFVLVGKGNSLKSWLQWPVDIEERLIDSSSVPPIVRKFVRSDEGGLFSIIDYCDVFSQALFGERGCVYRVQTPMKWQPNEIDGLYISDYKGKIQVFPVEAKSLTTQDEINLDQLQGGFITVRKKMQELGFNYDIQQIVAKMIVNGIDIGVFPQNELPKHTEMCYRIKFSPPIESWK